MLEDSTASDGSPPPMRGLDGDDYDDLIKTRITPAHAGTSSWNFLEKDDIGDHPRPCGD